MPVLWWLVCAISLFRFFRLFARRYGAAPKRNNAKRKDEITKQKTPHKKKNKKRNKARRKVEKTK